MIKIMTIVYLTWFCLLYLALIEDMVFGIFDSDNDKNRSKKNSYFHTYYWGLRFIFIVYNHYNTDNERKLFIFWNTCEKYIVCFSQHYQFFDIIKSDFDVFTDLTSITSAESSHVLLSDFRYLDNIEWSCYFCIHEKIPKKKKQ